MLFRLDDEKVRTAVTIGNFDGVHIGHQKIIRNVVDYAHQRNLASVAVIFEPQAQQFFAADKKKFMRLSCLREKWLKLLDFGIDYPCCLHFDSDFIKLSAKEYVQKILLEKLHTDYLMVGEDFRFGRGREGDVALLKKMSVTCGFKLGISQTTNYAGRRVSSTWIRELITSGNLDLAEKLLAKKYSALGRVVHGDGRGKKLGFATANLGLKSFKLLPPDGIYLVKVKLCENTKEYFGVANLGMRPTFKSDNKRVLETYILDFKQNIYGQMLEISFMRKLRDEKKFVSREALCKQMAKDVAKAKELQNHS